MFSSTVQITEMGEIAHQVLERSNGGWVRGSSSRGVFLQPDDDWTLFLSREGVPGPLTCSLEETSLLPDTLESGLSFLVSGDQIIIPQAGTTLDIKEGKIWKPAHPAGSSRNLKESLVTLPALVSDLAGASPYYPLLESSLGDSQQLIPDLTDLGKIWCQLLTSLAAADFPAIKSSADLLLGLGPGLTPLGDDLLLGLLLTLNRWSELVPVDFPLDKLNTFLLDGALEKTTKVSASLLYCAISGTADQRLVQVLDGFFSDEGPQEDDIVSLLDWGNSSGIAVLAGMLLGLS